jgi:hypothetical protein
MDRHLYKLLPLALLFVFSSILGRAQQTGALLEHYFSEVRSGKYQPIPEKFSLPGEAKATLTAIEPYLRDSVADVREKAYAIVQLAGNNAQLAPVREDAVAKLVSACKDRDSGNAGKALDYLSGFGKEDYTPTSKDSLVALFRRKSPHYDALIRLIGFLELKQLQADLRTLSQQGTSPRKDRWSAMLALARMGDTYAMDDVMKRVQRLPITDEVVYDIFPDLVYTRQRPAIDYLLVSLNSDEKSCSPASADHDAKIPCAYRVMEMLAPAIEGYPLKLDESGDVETKDYPAALQTVREWFKVNKNFKILSDKL